MHLQFKPHAGVKCTQARACTHSRSIFVPNVSTPLSAGCKQSGQVVRAANGTDRRFIHQLAKHWMCGQGGKNNKSNSSEGNKFVYVYVYGNAESSDLSAVVSEV